MPGKRTGGKEGPPFGSQNALVHGLSAARRILRTYGDRAIDKRAHFARELAKWRRALIADLGGDVSIQQSVIVDLAVKNKLLIDSIDVWLSDERNVLNKRRKTLYPVVMQRQALADGLARYMAQLGLHRVTKVKTLEQILAESESENGVTKDNKP